MFFQAVLLFLATLLGGLVVLLMPRFGPAAFRLVLAFTGSYLFAIIFLHILPDLFSLHTSLYTSATQMGLYVLLGFFLQLFLEFFSKGVEHGHLYEEGHEVQLRGLSPLPLLVAFCIHAFMDGVILNPVFSFASPHVSYVYYEYNPYRLLVGMILHKASEAFALVTVLRKLVRRKGSIFLYLVCASLAAPLGLWLSAHGSQYLSLTNDEWLVALTAVAGGGFLYIAMTIFLEAIPHDQLNAARLAATLAGAGLVVCLEFLL
jgi:zinc transporter ZupT